MTDTTHLTRIRELAEEGQKGAYNSTMYRNELGEQFGAILHNLNQMEIDSLASIIVEDAMDTDTTDAEEPQWWIVKHNSAGWSVEPSMLKHHVIYQRLERDYWDHYARVHCPRAEAEQAAVDAWAEAGFAHAPQEPPQPKQVEVTGYAVAQYRTQLNDIRYFGYLSQEEADHDRPDGYRIVKVEAVVSEVEG